MWPKYTTKMQGMTKICATINQYGRVAPWDGGDGDSLAGVPALKNRRDSSVYATG